MNSPTPFVTDEQFNINTRLWNEVGITNPAFVKPIKGKDYQGSSANPFWVTQRATQVFGPCGQGWWVEVRDQGYQVMSEDVIMHWALVRFNYVLDGKHGFTEHMGGTKAKYKTTNGDLKFDEDAPKKSVTDGLMKAMSQSGFCADIYMGLWDDCRYREFADNYHNNKDHQQPQAELKPGQVMFNNHIYKNGAHLTEAKLNEALNQVITKINSATTFEELNVASAFFLDTPHAEKVKKICDAKAAQDGANMTQGEYINVV